MGLVRRNFVTDSSLQTMTPAPGQYEIAEAYPHRSSSNPYRHPTGGMILPFSSPINSSRIPIAKSNHLGQKKYLIAYFPN